MGENIQKPIPTDTLIFDDPQMVGWLKEKESLVKEGRLVSEKIDEVEKEIQTYIDKEKELTSAVQPTELITEGDSIRDEINTLIVRLEEVGKKIKEAKLGAIPSEMEKEHLTLNDKREKLEKERNQLALKVQKIKDRFVPKLQKEAKKHLGEFEDIMTADLVGDTIRVDKFSHLQEWKRLWNEKNKIK